MTPAQVLTGVTDLMQDVSTIFTKSVEMIVTTTQTITDSPLLLVFSLIGFVGLGIGLTKRLLSLN